MRSASAPRKATVSVASTAASQKFIFTPSMPITNVAPMNAHTRNGGRRLRSKHHTTQKRGETPADSRNNKPPKVMLLAVSTSQKVMVAVVPATVSRAGGRLRGARCVAVNYDLSGG